MKRRVATNWKEKRFSRDGRGTTRWSLYFPQMEKGKRREAKRRRERWRSMWEMYVWTRKRGEINSRGLHGIGRIGVYFTENIPCNCNDDLYRDKRIDFLPRISPCPRRPKKGVHYTIYTSIIQGSVCALFSPIFYRDRESFKGFWRTDISMLDFCTLYLYRRMDSTNRARKYDVEVDDGNSFGRSIACSPPVFFTTSRSGTVINFLHLRFEYLLDILFLFHISRVPVMDSSIEIHELSSIS